jgi:uncharacterized protein (TIGR03435 family)
MGWRLAVVTMMAMLGVVTSAQQSTPAFEVASVRQNTSGEDRWYGGVNTTQPGAVRFSNMPLQNIIYNAYGVDLLMQRFLVDGGPQNLLSQRFDVDALPPEGTMPSQKLAMLRTLLAERFKLRTHIEKRQVPTYAMTVARPGRLGSQLRPSPIDCEAFLKARSQDRSLEPPLGRDGKAICNRYDFPSANSRSMGIGDSGTMALLARRLQSYADRIVVDETGLAGNFEWTMSMPMSEMSADQAGTFLWAVQDQLGLKLQMRTAPMDVLVIDSVEMPTPN